MRVVFFVGGVEGPRTPEGGLTGKGGGVRAGMGWERRERNSEGMGGVRVFSGGVNDGRGGSFFGGCE